MDKRTGGGHRIKYFLISLITFIFSVPAFANTGTPLHDKPPGTIITFSGKQWIILDQKPDGTTFIILNSNDGNRVFDGGNTQLFDPADSDNIGYYLNNEFYNSLSQKELIIDYSWYMTNGINVYPSVNCKIALIGVDLYNYRHLLSATGYPWWTRVPHAFSNAVWYFNPDGSIKYVATPINALGIRPVMYLKPNLMVSALNEVFEIILPPLPPTGLNATATAHNQAQLSWQPNAEPDLAGYIIYRNYVEIARVGAAETSYTDSGLQPDTTYTYGIMAYKTSLVMSDMSNAATVKTPKLDNPVLTVRIDGKTIKMSWTGYADNYLVKVNGQQVASTTEKQYDYAAQPGSYTIQVVAVAGSNQLASNTVTVQVSSITTPPASVMASDVLNNAGIVLYSAGGLLALALALKASPLVIEAVKAGFFRRFF